MAVWRILRDALVPAHTLKVCTLKCYLILNLSATTNPLGNILFLTVITHGSEIVLQFKIKPKFGINADVYVKQ